MQPRLSPLALSNFVLAALVIAIGWPSIISIFHRLPAEVVIGEIKNGQLVDRADLERVLPNLAAAAQWSPAARADLATALLATATSASGIARANAAADQLKAYLAEAPGDSLRWADLADAELIAGNNKEALGPLRMSILTAPGSSSLFGASSLLLWRCSVGIDLGLVRDDEGRRLLAEQFRIAMDRSPTSFVALMKQKEAVPLATILLAGNPETLKKFEAELARK